jgi:Xaa-Pro aminopeptidase
MNSKDLAYFVITATVSRYAIEKTLAHAEQCVHQGVNLTENELFQQYKNLIAEFVNKKKIPVPIKVYFTNLHAGSRSLYPAVPSYYPVNKKGKTYKLDAGLMALDGPGLIHACSDVARTVTFTPEGKEIYDIMQKCAHETIQAVKPGKTFQDIYWTGIKKLASFQDKIRAIGMLPEGFMLTTDYRRDIGHLLERQEAFTATFCRDKNDILDKYMLGCVEYQWPYKNHSIAFEEMFIVTNKGGICLTKGKDELMSKLY